MQSKILERILNENNELLEEIINTVKNNDVFNNVMSDVKEQYFIDDAIHGISHNERVALLACYIGIKEGLNNEELRLVLEASKYHDIGRGFDGNHGQVSTLLIDRNRDYIFPNLNDNEVKIVKALCNGHSVDDKKYEEIARLYGIENFEQFKKLLDIVKDADALDRVRLPRFGKLDEKYLRTEISKGMIDASKELYRKYKEIQRELENDSSRENIETSSYEFNEGLRRGLLFDGENYYLVRSLNKSDIESLNNGNGIVPKIESTDEYTVQDVMAQIRMQHRNTSLISMSEDPNIVLTYNRSNLHRFVLIRLSKDEIENHQKVFSAGEYLLGVMDNKIENATQNAPENVRNILEKVDSASSIEEIVKIINGADRQVPTSLVEAEQQYLTTEEQLEQSKKIAKCKVLNYYGLMRNITDDEKGKPVDISSFTQIMRNGYSSSEWLYSGKIDQEKIINIPQILVDSLALIKQAEFQGKDREILKRIEQEILRLATFGIELNQDNYKLEYTSHENLKNDLTIDKAYEITDGQISYRDTNMQMTAIRLLAEMTLNKRKIIQLLQERFSDIDINELLSDTYCVNQEMVTRQNNRGSQIGRNISFLISDYGYDFDDETSEQILQNVESLSDEQLVNIIEQGINAQGINDLLIKTRENDERIQATRSKTLGSKYIAEAIVEGYNWKQTGNSLTKQEKTLVANTLLKGLTADNELYTLYEAINKIQIGRNKFTQNEIFAIMINIAIDGKIGDISYRELTKKDRSEIQHILLDNKESLQTSVLPISIDLLDGRGKEINKLKRELIDLGIEKDFIDSKDIKNVYVAKQIVEDYDFGREITKSEKKALIVSILNPLALDNNGGVYYLSTLLQNMREIGLTKQELYGAIINLSINSRFFDRRGYSYTALLMNQNNSCQTIQKYKSEIPTSITKIDILKALSNNVTIQETKDLKEYFIKLGLNKELLEEKDVSNLFLVKQIIEEYEFDEEISDEIKGSLAYSLLHRKSLNKGNHTYLYSLMKNLDSIGLSEQQIYGTIINFGIDGYIIEKEKFPFSRLLDSSRKYCQLLLAYREQIPTEVSKLSIIRAIQSNPNTNSSEKIREEFINLGADEKLINSIYLPNIYAAKQIIEGYDFSKEISNDEKIAILQSILKNNSTLLYRPFLRTLIQNMEQTGLTEQQIYGMIINLGVNGKILNRDGYSYSNLLMNDNNACQTIMQYKDDIQTKVTATTILTALSDNINENQYKKIKDELIDLGIAENFIKSKNIKNVYVAKQIVDRYNFGRDFTNEEKRVIIQSILNQSILDNKPYLISLIRDMELMGLDEQEVYGMIINLSINESVLEETGYNYSNLLTNKNNARQTISKYKDKIQTKVTEGTILEALSNNIRGNAQEIIKSRFIDLGINEEFINHIAMKNLYVAEIILAEYDFKRNLSKKEKGAILLSILNNSNFRKSTSLSVLIRHMEQIGLNIQEIYGMIINLGINGRVIQAPRYSYSELLMNKNNACQNIVEYKSEIQTQVTEETIQKAVQKANKPKKVKGQDIAKATMELAVEGNGGSQVCDDVQADYQRLMNEKIKENEKEGSEQDDTN